MYTIKGVEEEKQKREGLTREKEIQAVLHTMAGIISKFCMVHGRIPSKEAGKTSTYGAHRLSLIPMLETTHPMAPAADLYNLPWCSVKLMSVNYVPRWHERVIR